MASGEGTFLSGRLLPTRTTVSCPPPPGEETHENRLDNDCFEPDCRASCPAKRQKGQLAVTVMSASDAKASLKSTRPSGVPLLVPNVYLLSGKIVEAESGLFEPVLDELRKPVDPFEVADRLAAKYQRFCVVDLEGIRRNRPQLDYLQELSRSGELWVDAGIRTGDQVIDILVTGARRTILSTASLLSPKELRRAWKLSTELLFAVEVEGPVVRSRGNDWDGTPVAEAIANARANGVADVVIRSRTGPVDWSVIRQQAKLGPMWVDGVPESTLTARLGPVGAIGGFFDAPRSALLGLQDSQ
jgi:hypothetical protein